jgi:hypothetical protein
VPEGPGPALAVSEAGRPGPETKLLTLRRNKRTKPMARKKISSLATDRRVQKSLCNCRLCGYKKNGSRPKGTTRV